MSLRISKDNYNQYNRLFVYKTVTELGFTSAFSSIFFPIPYIIGKVVLSDRNTTEVTEEEIKSGYIERGIHVYTTKEEALASKHWSETMLECEVDPKDHVSDGEKGNVVYTKVIPTKVILRGTLEVVK